MTAAELRRWDIDLAADSFMVHQLTTTMLEDADCVLGCTLNDRASIVQALPGALGVTFTLREFARLAASVDGAELPDDPVPRAHALIEQVWLRRGLLPPLDASEEEVPDPIGHPQSVHHRAAILIHEAVEAIIDVIAPPGHADRLDRQGLAPSSRPAKDDVEGVLGRDAPR